MVLPLSPGLVSVLGGVVLFTALAEDSWKNKKERFQKRLYLITIPAIFFIYLISSINTFSEGDSLYDLQKTLFFLVLPVAFLFGKNINNQQRRFVFYVFVAAVTCSIIVALVRWHLMEETENFSVHKIGLISHIRFSFQLILAFWFLILLLLNNFSQLKKTIIVGIAITASFILTFLLFQQSLTGLVAFSASIIFYLLYFTFQLNQKYRYVLLVAVFLMVSIPFVYVYKIVDSFYDIEIVDENALPAKTNQGNSYQHDVNNKMVENGNYVYLYVCEDEMRTEWNKISEFEYDSIGTSGYPLKATLIRYLTSKGLKKDAEGLKALDAQDIQNIEKGIANIIFQKRKYSIYPRFYQTVWEYYVYTQTGDANNQSFSQRLEFYQAAISIIKDNPWLGVGTGRWKSEFRNAFIKNKSSLNKNRYASSHNQYLNYLVKFGILGFLLILAFLIYPILKTKKYTDLLFLIFLVFLFFANFADSNFESHMGSSFFIFFYCLFITSTENNYLSLKEKSMLD